MTRANFVRLVREICEEDGIVCETFSMDWIIKFAKNGNTAYVYGYHFDINGSASMQICGDKNATYLCLSKSAVQCVPHVAFMNPNDPLVFEYVDRAGSLTAIHSFAKEHEYNVVLKPLKGTGGNGVFHASSGKEVEAAALALFERDYALSVSPYKEILNEFRVVVLNGKVRLCYRKVRRSVLGDGRRNIQQLVGGLLLLDLELDLITALAGLSKEKLGLVLPEGETFPIEWRHNLGKGAVVEVLNSKENLALCALAVSAAAALGVAFCSVDIVNTKEEGLLVLEVNAGVMMDSFLAENEPQRALAKSIYRDAIRSSIVNIVF